MDPTAQNSADLDVLAAIASEIHTSSGEAEQKQTSNQTELQTTYANTRPLSNTSVATATNQMMKITTVNNTIVANKKPLHRCKECGYSTVQVTRFLKHTDDRLCPMLKTTTPSPPDKGSVLSYNPTFFTPPQNSAPKIVGNTQVAVTPPSVQSTLPEIYRGQKPIVISFSPKLPTAPPQNTPPPLPPIATLSDSLKRTLDILGNEITMLMQKKRAFELKTILDPNLDKTVAYELLAKRLDCENQLENKLNEFIVTRSRWSTMQADPAAAKRQITWLAE
jgi:hypothetical protein